MKLCMVASIAVTWLCSAAAAGAIDLDATVAGHAGLTYFQLLKLVVTDLAPGLDGAKGRNIVPFRHIEGKGNETDPPDPIVIQSLDAMPIPGDAGRIVLLIDLGTPQDSITDASMLALFSLAPRPRLLDVVEVGTDRDVGFAGDKTPAMLAPRSPLIVVSSGHDNSDQSYRSTAMIFIRDDRFRFIDSVFTFGDADCSHRRTQEPLFATLTAPGPYSGLDVQVRETVTVPGEGCEGGDKPIGTHKSVYRAVYHWDGARDRFVTRSRELDRLSAENAKRF